MNPDTAQLKVKLPAAVSKYLNIIGSWITLASAVKGKASRCYKQTQTTKGRISPASHCNPIQTPM